jgi:SAM-dependent methyltransferase
MTPSVSDEPDDVADAGADLVIGNLVLEHVEALDDVFAEVARALRDGGECYFCELHPYRQWLGKQARFTHPETGETVRVASFPHDASDYVNAAIRAGLHILAVHEWRDEASAATPAIPRLFALRCKRRPRWSALPERVPCAPPSAAGAASALSAGHSPPPRPLVGVIAPAPGVEAGRKWRQSSPRSR